MPRRLSKVDVEQFNREMAYYKKESRESVRNAVLNAIDEAGDEPSDDDLRAICNVAADSMCIATYGDWEYIATMSDDLVQMLTGGAIPGFDFDASDVFSSESEIRAVIDSHMDSVRSGEMSLSEFSNRVADCADIEVKNMYARTLDRIVGRRDDARWARVPVGKSCEWCIMTGSLGYYYYSAQAAAKASHAKCNCLIVPKIGSKTPEIDGYDPDELYMQWVDGLKRECAENKCSQRKEREYSVSKNRGNWSVENPIKVMADIAFDFECKAIQKNGKKRYVSKQTDYQVIIDALNGYFRVMYIGKDRGIGDNGIRMIDGSIPPYDNLESQTHYTIERFLND